MPFPPRKTAPEPLPRHLSWGVIGTLVDGNAGLSKGIAEALKASGRLLSSGVVQQVWEVESEIIEQLEEYQPYRAVLAQAIQEAAGLDEARAEAVAAGIRDWPLFDDSVEALRNLVQRFSISFLSNLEMSDLEPIVARFRLKAYRAIGSDRVGCYKPEPDHFLALMHERELEPEELLHVSARPARDLRPAEDLGIAAVFLNRGHSRLDPEINVLQKVRDLSTLTKRLIGSR